MTLRNACVLAISIDFLQFVCYNILKNIRKVKKEHKSEVNLLTSFAKFLRLGGVIYAGRGIQKFTCKDPTAKM